MSGRPITEDDLNAYVDGALDTERHDEVSDYLVQHPDVAHRVSAYRRQRDQLRSALLPIAQEPVPADLNVDHLIERQRHRRRSAIPTAAAAALLVCVGAAGGWLARGELRPVSVGIEALANEAEDNYEVHAPDRTRPVELRAADRAQLVQWASQRIGRPVTVPDLSTSGYRFMGGRLVATAHGPAVLFMYDDDRGTRLVMLTRPMAIERNTAMTLHSRGVVASFTWESRGIGYSLVGPVAENLLHPIADQVRRQVESGA